MSITVDNIQSQVAGVVDQDQDTSNISTTDYDLRLSYLNRRERMWSELGKWQCLYKEFHSCTSLDSGNASVALPTDFRFIASFPKITYDGVNTEEFPVIRGQEEGQRLSTDKYVKILGNSNNGYCMVVNPGTSSGFMVSGASIFVPYFLTPSSHVSPADVVYCPNPDYLVQGVIADIWEAREDARFQQAKVEANRILQNMLEFEMTPSEASADNRVRTVEETKYGFRLGRD